MYNNGTRKRIFKNGTRAIYTFNGVSNVFSRWEVVPTRFYEQCFAAVTYDGEDSTYWPWDQGGNWVNCTVGQNGWNATFTYSTQTEAAAQASRELRIKFYTGPMTDSFYPNGTLRRVFNNGTIAIYQFNGLFYGFIRFEKAPQSQYVDCDVGPYGFMTNDYDS